LNGAGIVGCNLHGKRHLPDYHGPGISLTLAVHGLRIAMRSSAAFQLNRRSRMKKLSILMAFLAAGILVGCNTMQGAGKDMERGGEKLQQSAKDTKEKM